MLQASIWNEILKSIKNVENDASKRYTTAMDCQHARQGNTCMIDVGATIQNDV